MRLGAALGSLAGAFLLLAVPSAAQTSAGDAHGQPGPGAGESAVQAPPVAFSWQRYGAVPFIGALLDDRAELGLSDAQVAHLERFTTDFVRHAIRRQADLEIADVDLDTLLWPDPTDPAKPVDLGKADAKIQEIERLGADLRMAYLRAVEAGKAELTADQRAKLASLRADDAPSGTPSAARVGGSRAPGSHPGGREARPEGRREFHPREHGRAFIGVGPWVWWPYWYYPPPLVLQEPPTYVQPPAYWYYCRSAGGYYPYVPSCPEPWIPVPAS